MVEEIPQILSLPQLSYLHDAYQKSQKIVESPSTEWRTVSTAELAGLDGLISNSAPYVFLANSLSSMNRDATEFQRSMEETLEYAIKYVRGQFNGRTEQEIKSVSSLLGIVPITASVGQSQGKTEGDINLGIYDYEKLVNALPSNHRWVKDFLAQYVTEINTALEPVKKGEPNARLKVEIDRMNNAIKDCYQEENVTRLKFACKNLSESYRHIRELMFPLTNWYPRVNDLLRETEGYITSLKQLAEFAKGKEQIRFSNEQDWRGIYAREGDKETSHKCIIYPNVGNFLDATHKPISSFWKRLLG